MLRHLSRVFAFLAIGSIAAAGDQPVYDLVIKRGRIIDGTGNPWFHADVAVLAGQIAKVGRLSEQEIRDARRVVDAQGLVVSPGFIDIHSHSDRTLFLDGSAPSKVRQGVTTEILGEHTSGGPYLDALAGETVEFGGKKHSITRLSTYLDALESAQVTPNVGTYVGLGNVWGSVMGSSFARPSPAQFERIKQILAEAMDDGAFGLSDMLASPDASVVTTDDLVELAKVVARYGGVYSSHIRNEGVDVLKSVDEAIAIGERAGVAVDIIHVKIAEKALWGRMDQIIARIEAARTRGVNVSTNLYPYTRGNNDLVSIVPPWAHEGGKGAMLARLRDPEQRKRIVQEICGGLPGWYNHYTAVGRDWSRMLISARLSEGNRRFQGKTMDVILKERTAGRPLDESQSVEAMLDFLAEENGSVGTIYAHHDEADMNLALIQPWCSVGSDGIALATDGRLRSEGGHPHPRSFGTFPRILGVYVRERRLLRLEDAVRKMSSLNAAKLGIQDRGLVREGMKADLAIFDPETVIDKATYLEPFQYPVGISYVVVNGRLVIDRGQPTSERPGKALRRGIR